MATEIQQIAETIMAQLGGTRFAMMTGAKNFMCGEKGELTFQYPCRNRKGFIRAGVKISLNVFDTYDVEFIDMKRNMELRTKLVSNVYHDQLQAVFTAETGLYTSLGTMGRQS